MDLYFGWVGTFLGSEKTEQQLRKVVNGAPEFIRQNVSYEFGNFYALVAGKDNIFKEQNCLLINVGNHAIENPAAVIKSYKQTGIDFLEHYKSSSSFIIIDLDLNIIFLICDPIGQINIYYSQTVSGLVFASSADFILSHPEISNDISSQTIYDYVYFHHCPSPNTIYRDIKKLEGGQLLTYGAGNTELKDYWQPKFEEKMNYSLDEAGIILKDLLTKSVANLSETSTETGAFLSGGLDSSSVAGALSLVHPGEAQTFTIGFPVEGYDEIEYARIAADHFKTKAHEYYLTPDDTVNAIPEIAAYYDEPFGNSSALAAYYCAKMAKESGIKVLLAGDGGDELFAGNERYAKQLLFEYYNLVPGVFRSGLESVLNHIPSALANNPIIHKARRYIDQANTPMPDRMEDYNFLQRHGYENIFQPGFLHSVDQNEPIHLLGKSYNRPDKASVLNRMLYMDWKTTLHDNDLVKVNRMCEMAGVDVRYPLLDRDIIDFSSRIPSNFKIKGQKLRWFYKKAFEGCLPDEIIYKSKHGFGLPFGIWLKDYQPLKELAYDSINGLKKRTFFKNEFLDNAIQMHQSIHAAYYGELIWILMMLELWFQGKKL